MEVVLEEEAQPHDEFKEKDMLKEWNTFIENLEEKGLYNYASILRIDTPRLSDKNTILLEFPNQTNKLEVERSKNDLLIYLRKKLNNYSINLEITVNEDLEKQFVYTPREKFEKMKEKNPSMSLLKKTFDLDI
jgi:DNA polymerase-3 subunit gamma/tau